MGVRGLTSYIAHKAELYLQPHELHDCDLVIDGDNLAYNLYRGIPECNSAFGGDYDIYYRTVKNFFEILFKCNIRPFVLMDGAYESKKMKTIEKRLRSKISAIKYINPATNNCYVFPLMMREVFIDAVKDSGGVHFMRCLFEADDELAILARKLNCPLLSYDSDFYIHNVKYIPVATLTLKVLEKKEKISQNTSTNLKHTLACNVKKRLIANKTLRGAGWEDKSGSSKEKTVRYLDCCIYTIENLISKKKISKDILPLFAALLGNDYIEGSIFRNFYSHLGMKGVCTKVTQQQKRIRAILNWLKHETKESAMEKIMNRMKKQQRIRLLTQINSATKGYNIEESKAFEYFCLNEDDYMKESLEDNKNNIEEESDGEDTEEFDEEDTEGSENEIEDEIQKDVNKNEEKITDESNKEELETCESESDTNKEQSDEVEESEAEVENLGFPSWVEKRQNSLDLPNFIVDLLHSRLYVNNPQIENFLFEDCNQIAIPILMHIYGCITYPESEELRYLTRVVRLTNVHYKQLKPVAPPYPFDPSTADLNALKAIFPTTEFHCEELFEEIEKVPSHLRLYLLAIVYWSKKTTHADVLHFYSLIICLVVLTTIDKNFIEVRNPRLFYKKYGKFIQSMKKLKEQSTEDKSSTIEKISKAKLIAQKAEEQTKNLLPEEKIKFIPKITSALVQERLLKLFNIREDFRKRHNDFSSTILHGFSEFQSVVYFINSLNTLVNKPFESIKIAQFYNGIFLYNLYTTLKGRTDVDYYIKNFILIDSSIIFDYYEFFIKWSKKFVGFFKEEKADISSKKSLKKKSKKKSKKQHSNNTEMNKISNSVEDMVDKETDTDTEFTDLNNKFCVLLRT